jgi:tetratricopeptide (TPR) repeat protein
MWCPSPARAGWAIRGEPPTTDGRIALKNLQAQIASLEVRAARGGLSAVSRAGLIELIALRGQVLGLIADYERAEALAERWALDERTDSLAFLARARMRATFHRFTDALADLARAEALGLGLEVLDHERAGILQAVGRSDEATELLQEALARRTSFETLGALAGLYAERGELARAEHLFTESRECYRRVSPFPLALLDVRRGQMWLEHGDLRRARAWFDAACCRVPCLAPAQGHLAEVEAAMGEPEVAIARLRPLAISSDDPAYAGQLARILGEIGRVAEARRWRSLAAARYEELAARYPAAFAEHAAEFWLAVGDDPSRALDLG